MKKVKIKETEHVIYLQLEDSAEGKAILDKFVDLFFDIKRDKAYLNGWIGPPPVYKRRK